MKVETKKLKLFLLDSGLISSKDIIEAENSQYAKPNVQHFSIIMN